MIFNRFQFLKRYFFKLKKRKRGKTVSALLEDDLYSLDSFQLKNLLDKNIHFDFFQLDSLNEKIRGKMQKYLNKALLKTKKEILSELKTEDFKKPLVLICKTGHDSKVFSQELRKKGFVNVYFIKKGFQSLLEDF